MVVANAEPYTPVWERWLGSDTIEAAFPLGGIGTGNISIGARGDLRDFEIWNEPRKGLILPYSHFTLWAQADGQASVTRVLEGRIPPPYALSHGIHPNHCGGLPRFAISRFRGQYPVAELELRDPEVPVDVDLLTYTPFVPLDADESGLPCAVFRWRLTNRGHTPVRATVAGSMLNPAGYAGTDSFGNLAPNPAGDPRNSWRDDGVVRGVFFESPPLPDDALAHGSAALTTLEDSVTAKPRWFRGGWYDALREFWQDLSTDGQLTQTSVDPTAGHGPVGPTVANVDAGSAGTAVTLLPGESRTVTFILSWYFPNRVNGWDRAAPEQPATTRIRYAGRFADAWSVAHYVAAHLAQLEKSTLEFRDALFGGTLPAVAVDAAAANIVVLRSNTCFWLEGGQFFGWEGCFDRGGSCHGNCTHVWAYAQTLAFLFPALEVSMLRTAFLDEVEESGKMRFRAAAFFHQPFRLSQAAADGQLGSIMRLWRAFLLTGDRDFLAATWPNVQKTLQYAFDHWDTDGDGLLDGQQHNTYDIEFYGPNPLTGVMLLGALRAAEEIALRLDDAAAAQHYRALYTRSAARLDESLWNGEYYRQLLADVDAYPYQHGEGCLSDQMLGQLLAHVAHLGHLLPAAHVTSALDAIYRYNFRRPLGNHVNLQRTYAFYDESGLLLCSWPRGEEPRLPFVYSDEVWTGIEYQMAAHLIYEGRVAEGLTLVAAVRQRHEGFRRNPWNEVECGHHYARAMASWALMTALTGFSCDIDRKVVRFAPAGDQGHVRALFTCGAGWGIYSQTADQSGEVTPDLTILGGDLDGFTVEVGRRSWKVAQGHLST